MKSFPEADEHRATAEAEALSGLGATDASGAIPRIIYSVDGSAVSAIGSVRLVATAWVPGRRRSWVSLDAVGFGRLGGVLGMLHRCLGEVHHLGGTPVGDSLPPLPDAAASVDAGTRRLRRAGLDGLIDLDRYADDRRRLLGRAGGYWGPVPEGLVHGDFNLHNVLYVGSRPVVFDWDGVLVAPPAYEVIRALRHVPLIAPERAMAFINGYCDHHPFGCAGVRAGWVMALVAWATKAWLDEAACRREPWAGDALRSEAEILRETVEGLDRLESFYLASMDQ